MSTRPTTGDVLGGWTLTDRIPASYDVAPTYSAMDRDGRPAVVQLRSVGERESYLRGPLQERIAAFEQLANHSELETGLRSTGGATVPWLFGHGEVDGVLYVAEATPVGEELPALTRRLGLLGAPRVVEYAAQLANVMTALWEQGVPFGRLRGRLWMSTSPAAGEILQMSEAILRTDVNTVLVLDAVDENGRDLAPEPYTSQSNVAVLAEWILLGLLFSQPIGPALDEVLSSGLAIRPQNRYATPLELVAAARSAVQRDEPVAAFRFAKGEPVSPHAMTGALPPGPWRVEVRHESQGPEPRVWDVDFRSRGPEDVDRIRQALADCDFWGEHPPSGQTGGVWTVTVTAADGAVRRQRNVLGLDPLLSAIYRLADRPVMPPPETSVYEGPSPSESAGPPTSTWNIPPSPPPRWSALELQRVGGFAGINEVLGPIRRRRLPTDAVDQLCALLAQLDAVQPVADPGIPDLIHYTVVVVVGRERHARTVPIGPQEALLGSLLSLLEPHGEWQSLKWNGRKYRKVRSGRSR